MRKYEITKEQIRLIEHQSINMDYGQVARDMREWFPEAFKPVLEVGKWNSYKEEGVLIFVTQIRQMPGYKEVHYYGFINGEWKKDYLANEYWRENLIPSTDSEVFEALKNEAIRRGYKNGNHRCLDSCITEQLVEDNYVFYNGYLWYGTNSSTNCVFQKGVWAEIIPAITKSEAEKQLGMKIID